MKKRNTLVLGIVTMALTACTIKWYYSPNVYEIAQGRIPPFEPIGSIAVRNEEPSDPEQSYEFFHQGAAIWKTDRKQIGEAIANQLAGELRKLGGTISESAPKQVAITVPSLAVEIGSWAMTARMKVGLTLGDRAERVLDIKNTSPGNMWRTVNGVIAIAVIEILTDPEVREYLSADAADTTDRPPS